MHASSMENMRRCIDWYLPAEPQTVVDLGSMNVNGSYRELFKSNVNYIGIDQSAGPGVDIVLTDVYTLPIEDASVDAVLSGQMLEHCEQFWRVFSEIYRVLKPGGVAFVIAPSAGPIHRFPVDCYRFYPDAFNALASWSGLRLVHSWLDERGPWCDVVGILQKEGQLEQISAPVCKFGEQDKTYIYHPACEAESHRGSRHYLDVLADLHELISPQRYLEIGVRKGRSLALARCASVAIDPAPHEDFDISGRDCQLFRCTSDDFFFFHAKHTLDHDIQFAFIDGMHLCEYVFRDFMNVERYMDSSGIIVIDDVLPNHPIQAQRSRCSQTWTGDVWRFAELLQNKRHDLQITWLNTSPTGLLLISKLDKNCKTLWEIYNPEINRIKIHPDEKIPDHVLSRSRAIEPTRRNLEYLCSLFRDSHTT